ncbi:MAG: hypothetical protein WC088_06605, partial [Candidatus Izemoplasmatales bacterium]
MKRKPNEPEALNPFDTRDQGFSPTDSQIDSKIKDYNVMAINGLLTNVADREVNFDNCDVDTLMDDIEAKKNSKMVIRFNSVGVVEYVSDKVLSIIKSSREDFIGKNISDFNDTLLIINSTW